MFSFKLKEITLAGLIAAVYAVLALALAPVSFGVYQVRISEALTVLPFMTRAAIPGLFFGCMIANVFGGMGWMDIVFGSVITLASALATRGVYHLTRGSNMKTLTLVPLVLMWGAAMFTLMSDGFNASAVVLIALSLVAQVIVVRLRPAGVLSRSTYLVCGALSLVLVLLALSRMMDNPDRTLFIIGSIATVGAWLVTWVVVHLWLTGKNPGIALAPLPPVLLNAFGVSLYLAPIMGVNYWFSVQMIGVGQLIACYFLGIPLLLLLQRRKGLFG